MRTFFQLILALLTLSALGWVVWQGYLLLNREQVALTDPTRSLLIIVAFLAIVCTYMLNSARRASAQTIAQGHLLPRKVELYEGFISVWFTLLKESDPEQKTRIALQMDEIKSMLTLLANQSVLQAMNEFLALIKSEGIPSPPAQKGFEKLLFTMREDLGQPITLSTKNEINTLFSSSNT